MFIELTFLDGTPLFLNADHIILVRPDGDNALIEINTKAHQNYYTVQESFKTVCGQIEDLLETLRL